jgi:hypothetical protein
MWHEALAMFANDPRSGTELAAALVDLPFLESQI